MNRRGLCRPSLRITQTGGQAEGSRFRVEVWNPFLHEYQSVNSAADGIKRVGQLADLIGRMWVQRHPKRDALMDVPMPAESAGPRWSELRINGTAFRTYDTRSDDCPRWTKATDMKQGMAKICAEVGYSMLDSTAAP